MGFWSKLGRGLTGAAVGLATGGPAGAVAGGVSGYMSGGGDTTTGTSSSTRSVNLRDLSPDEQRLYNQNVAGAEASGKQLTPEEIAKLRESSYSAIFDPASQTISQNYETRGASQSASAARRGASVASAGLDREMLNTAAEGRELGRASATATLGAEQLVAQEQANRRANAQAYMNNINSIWRRQLETSSITTTGSQEQTSPDTFWRSAAAGVGQAIGDKDSWLRTEGNDLFGGV